MDDTSKDVYSLLAQELKVNKHLYLCHLLILSSPTYMCAEMSKEKGLVLLQ